MKKICVCIDSLKIGGAERLVVDLINNWGTDWKIYLITFFDRNDLVTSLNRDKIEGHIILGADCPRSKAIKVMDKFCREKHIDIALCHLERPNKWLAIGAKLAGSGIISTVHSINIYDKESILKRIWIKFLYNIVPHRIVAISDTVKRYLTTLGIKKDKIVLIPNGIDTRAIQMKYSAPRPKRNLDLVVLARLEPVKAIDILFKALAQLYKEGWEWSLKIIGDGSQLQELRQLSNNLKLADRIEFLGFQKEPLNFLGDRAAICMPSCREGLPIALLESLALGLPAIVSNVGYLPRIISDGKNGYVCKAGSVESLATCLRKLGSLSQKQWYEFSQAARDTIKDYDIQACVKKYQKIANSLI